VATHLPQPAGRCISLERSQRGCTLVARARTRAPIRSCRKRRVSGMPAGGRGLDLGAGAFQGQSASGLLRSSRNSLANLAPDRHRRQRLTGTFALTWRRSLRRKQDHRLSE